MHSGKEAFRISTEKCCAVGRGYEPLCSGADLYSVSQFTLLASTKKGSKPDFHGAMGGDQAKVLYQHFVTRVQEGYSPYNEKVKDGVFQAMMEVASVNDGPVSLWMRP